MSELRLNREAIFCERPPFPKNMMIELTNICNHRCVFCNYCNMTRKKMSCDMELTKRIMAEAYSLGTREVGFYLIGEPFLCREFEEYVRYAKSLGFSYIYVTSNGAEATPERLKRIIDAGLNSIKFSINGASRDTYLKVHGKDDFERVLNNITWLHNYIRDNKLEVSTFVSFVKCNYNKHEIDTIHSLYDGLVDKVYVFECSNYGGRLSNALEQGAVDETIPISAPCSMVFNRLHITVEGYMTACCADANGDLVVANLREKNLMEAWNSEIMESLRRQHLTGKFERNLCYNCIKNVDGKINKLQITEREI